MTTGHKHRLVKVRSWTSRTVLLLRKPLWHTTDMARVNPSPYPYGPCDSPRCPSTYQHPQPDCWTLSLLGILHRWTGLTLWLPANPSFHVDE